MSEPSPSSTPLARWLLIAGAAVVALALAVWVFRAPTPTVDDYRDELTALAAPDTPGDAEPIAIGARALLDATAEEPVRADLMRRAARWFDNAAQGDDPDGQASFYAGLAWGLAGRDDLARQAFEAVPEGSPYHRSARAGLR